MAFPDLDVKDFTAGTAKVVKGFDLGSSKLALAHGIVDASGNLIVKKIDDALGATDGGLVVLARQTAVPANVAGTNADAEALQMSGGHLWVAPPPLTKVSSNFTVAAGSSHVANDAIADNATAGSVTKSSWAISRSTGVIRRVKITKSDGSVATPTIRLWLFDATFTPTAGDDAAFTAPMATCIGFVDVAVVNAGDGVDAAGWTNCDIPVTAATAFGLLQTLSTFITGASEVFTIDLWYLPG